MEFATQPGARQRRGALGAPPAGAFAHRHQRHSGELRAHALSRSWHRRQRRSRISPQTRTPRMADGSAGRRRGALEETIWASLLRSSLGARAVWRPIVISLAWG